MLGRINTDAHLRHLRQLLIHKPCLLCTVGSMAASSSAASRCVLKPMVHPSPLLPIRPCLLG
jgi:hypothetical protein